MKNIVTLKCPECKSDFLIGSDRKRCFCQHCGIEMSLGDGEIKYTHRQVDEARIREVKLKERQQEYLEKTNERLVKWTILCLAVAAVLAVTGVVLDECDILSYRSNIPSTCGLFAFIIALIPVFIWLFHTRSKK